MAAYTVETMEEIEIRKNKLGWGGVVKFTTRPYAALVRGKYLNNKAGRIRTFESKPAAKKAALTALAEGYGKDNS